MSYDYPTDEQLTQVQTWEGTLGEWFTFVQTMWWAPEWGWREERGVDEIAETPVTRYRISTGGWSGNEDIIDAMQESLGWSFTWVQSRRGGHYIFEVPDALADFVLNAKEETVR